MTQNIAAELPAPPEPGYLALFEAMPGNHLLLQANPPLFTMLAITPQRQRDVCFAPEEVMGRPLFELHPGNPNDPTDNGVRNLRASLEYVILHKQAHTLPVQRYDLPDGRGGYTEKYWSATNRPVLDAGGAVSCIIHTAEDITGTVKAEAREAQIQGIEKAFALFMHAPMVVGLVTGDDYVLEMANEQAFAFWGKSPAEIIGKPVLQALPELAGQGIVERFDEVRRTGKPHFANEVPMQSLAGGRKETHHFNLIYQPYFGGDGTAATGIFTIAHDVTELVAARRREEESKTRLTALIQQTPAPTLVLQGDDLRIEQINAPMLRLMGRGEEVVGRPLIEIMPELKGQYAWTQVQRVYREGISFDLAEVLTPHNRHGGVEDYYYNVGYRPLREGGRITGMILVALDVTAHVLAKKALEWSEQNLRNTILQAPVAMCKFKGGDYTVEIANEKMFEFWGKSSHEVLGKPVFEGLPEARGQGFEALLHSVYTTGKTVQLFEVPVALPRGGKLAHVFVNFVYEAFRERDETISGIMAVAVEVTAQVQARQKIEEVVAQRTGELERANEALKRSNQNLEEFAHAASHDLKEPVRKIHFYTNGLKEQLTPHLDERQAKTFSRIENATLRMGQLIDDLLLYSHVSLRPHEMTPVDLNEKLAQVLEDLELDIDQKGAAVHIGSLPTVPGYERQLQQLFQNLLSNALKYSRAGVPPDIRISAAAVREGDMHFHRIAVQDNGIGFAPEYADKIFQMFARLHGKAEYSGTGVGLSIVKKVVENHGGYIRVESVEGEGSRFEIYLLG